MSGSDLGLPWVPSSARQYKLVAVAEIDVNDFLVVSPATAAKLVSGSTYTLVKLPSNAIVTGGSIIVTTAFDSTTLTVDVGDTGSGNRYGNDVDFTTAAATALTAVPFNNPTGLDVKITPTMTGTPTVGHAIITVEYVIRGRGQEPQA